MNIQKTIQAIKDFKVCYYDGDKSHGAIKYLFKPRKVVHGCDDMHMYDALSHTVDIKASEVGDNVIINYHSTINIGTSGRIIRELKFVLKGEIGENINFYNYHDVVTKNENHVNSRFFSYPIHSNLKLCIYFGIRKRKPTQITFFCDNIGEKE